MIFFYFYTSKANLVFVGNNYEFDIIKKYTKEKFTNLIAQFENIYHSK